MGEINSTKPLCCLICDSDIHLNQSYSIFYTFITNSGVRLANSLEKHLSLKDLGSLSLRSNFLCTKCFGYFEQLSDCENKIVKLKGDLWAIYKETCEKRGEEIENHIKGVSTQTDLNEIIDDDSRNKRNQQVLNLKEEVFDEDKELDENDENQGYTDQLEIHENEIKLEGEKPSEEITVEADPHFNDDDPSKWKRRPESCKLCGKWFKKVVELDNHMLVHVDMDKNSGEDDGISRTRKKFHYCSVCNKKFRRPCELKEHMLSHKPSTPFVCKYCGKKLKSKTGAIYHTLKTHKIDITNNKNIEDHFYVDVINQQDSKKDDSENEEEFVDENEVSDEGKEGKTVAGDIDTSSSEDELPLARRRKEFIFEKIKQEINSETPEAPKKRKSAQKRALQALKKWCEVSVTKVSKVVEEGTKKKFVPLPKPKQEDDLLSVVEKIDNEEIRSKITDLSKTNEVTIQSKSECASSDADNAQAANFLSNVGLSDKAKTRAKKCPVNALLKAKRQKDTSLPPPMKEPKFKCDLCGKMWKTRGELNAHKITHSDARPYICEICGQAYKHKPALDVHVGMHRGIYHHQCPYCQKAFTQKGALQRHLPIHTGDLPYQCELCGKRFVHRTSFSIHTMAHTGVRNIRCKVCNLGVLSKSHLRRHMRIHTGEKPYECQTCGKAFAERYNLVAHQRIHDPNLSGPARQQKKKIQTCRLCSASFDKRYKLEEHMVTVHNKVVDDPPRPCIFDTGEGFTAPRLTVDRFDDRKPQERDEQDDKSNVNIGNDNNPNDLSVRNLQNLHNLRNLELLRNLESNRNFELIRMANGITGVDEGLRIPGAGSGTPWTYINPGS